jgi:hypothetical protein
MNSADVLQWVKSFIRDENIIKVFAGNLICFSFDHVVFTCMNMYIISDLINVTCLRLFHSLIYQKIV